MSNIDLDRETRGLRGEPAQTETELWAALGYDVGRGLANVKVRGADRRLRAGLRSLATRGFSSGDVTLHGSREDLSFEINSPYGAWSTRSWVVAGHVAVSPAGDVLRHYGKGISVTGAAFKVGSRAHPGEETTYTGAVIDAAAGARLKEMLEIIGARAMVEPGCGLTHPEAHARQQANGMHPAPVGAINGGPGRAVLWDDDHGSASIEYQGDAARVRARLLEVGIGEAWSEPEEWERALIAGGGRS